MPNQYTKFQAASEHPTTRAFTWREWSGKKQKRGRRANKKDARATDGRKGSPSDGSTPTSHDTDARSSSTASSPLTSPSSSLLQYLPSGGLRMDPFRSYPVTPDHAEMAVLDHYLYILAPSGKHNETVFRPRTQHIDPHINLLLPCVMQDRSLFDAMLASCQASISLSSGLSVYNDPFFMLHRGRAMAGLRQKLANKPDTSVLLSITLLITGDYLLGDIQAVAGHTRALQRMVEYFGDLPTKSRWDRFIKHGVEAYKYVGLMATGIADNDQNSPLESQVDPFIDLEYPEQPFSPEACEQWTNLPPGFLDLMFASQLSTQLCAIITAFDQIATRINPNGVENLRILHPIQAALQRFSQHKQATYLERCITAGLSAYTFQYPRIQILNMFHDPPMQGMLRLFSVSYRSQSKIEREALIWAVIVTQGFMSGRASPLPKSKEVFTRFVERQPLMKSWPGVEKVLRRYLWTPSLLERWKICHEALLRESDPGKPRTATSNPIKDHFEPVMNTASQNLMVCPVTGQLTDVVGANSGVCPFYRGTASSVTQSGMSTLEKELP